MVAKLSSFIAGAMGDLAALWTKDLDDATHYTTEAASLVAHALASRTVVAIKLALTAQEKEYEAL